MLGGQVTERGTLLDLCGNRQPEGIGHRDAVRHTQAPRATTDVLPALRAAKSVDGIARAASVPVGPGLASESRLEPPRRQALRPCPPPRRARTASPPLRQRPPPAHHRRCARSRDWSSGPRRSCEQRRVPVCRREQTNEVERSDDRDRPPCQGSFTSCARGATTPPPARSARNRNHLGYDVDTFR
jgi:hypothetical protein